MALLRLECVFIPFLIPSRHLMVLKDLVRRLKLLWCGLLQQEPQTSGLISGYVIDFCGGESLP